MKRALLVGILILLGVGLFFYPQIANYFSEQNASKAVQDYAAAASAWTPEQLAEELKKAQDYNDALVGQKIQDPFLEGSGMVLGENYMELLNLAGNGIMGAVRIPKINVSLPIAHGTEEETLRTNVGHLLGSSLPVGGLGTHSVLTGHTGLTTAKLFTNLIELREGDLFFLDVLNLTLAYQVDQIKVVLPYDTEDLLPVLDKDYVTLLTCTPYGVNSHRLLVRGVRILPYSVALEEKASTETVNTLTAEQRLLLITSIVTGLIMLGLIIIVAVIAKRKRKREEEEEANRAQQDNDVNQAPTEMQGELPENLSPEVEMIKKKRWWEREE